MEENTFGTNWQESKKNNHIGGLFAGIGVAIVVGAIAAGLSMLMEQEFGIWIGLVAVAFIVSRFVPNKSAMGAITGGIAGAVMCFAYAFVLLMGGYWYTDGDSGFWITFAIGSIFSAIWGYKGKKNWSGEE